MNNNLNLNTVTDSLVESYFKDGTYDKLPLDIMKKTYKSLIDIDYDEYILSNSFMNEREIDFEFVMQFSCIIITIISGNLAVALTGNILSLLVSTPIFLIGYPRIVKYIHEKNNKKKIRKLIDEIAKEYCLLPSKDFKRLEQLRNENVVTKELIELERKEASLKEAYGKIKEKEDNHKRLIEEETNNVSQQLKSNLTNSNDSILSNPQSVHNKDLSDATFINDYSSNVFSAEDSINFNEVNLSNAQIISEEPLFINYEDSIINEETNIDFGNAKVKNKKI